MINFVLVDKGVRFEINARSLDGDGLKVGSKRLAVAWPMVPRIHERESLPLFASD